MIRARRSNFSGPSLGSRFSTLMVATASSSRSAGAVVSRWRLPETRVGCSVTWA
jgi:hypothetical protein